MKDCQIQMCNSAYFRKAKNDVQQWNKIQTISFLFTVYIFHKMFLNKDKILANQMHIGIIFEQPEVVFFAWSSTSNKDCELKTLIFYYYQNSWFEIQSSKNCEGSCIK